jgi:hypothetical protein
LRNSASPKHAYAIPRLTISIDVPGKDFVVLQGFLSIPELQDRPFLFGTETKRHMSHNATNPYFALLPTFRHHHETGTTHRRQINPESLIRERLAQKTAPHPLVLISSGDGSGNLYVRQAHFPRRYPMPHREFRHTLHNLNAPDGRTTVGVWKACTSLTTVE